MGKQLPRYVYTGYCPKDNGLLILTDDDWSTLAARLGLQHVLVESGEIKQHVFAFSDVEVNEQDVLNFNPRRGSWFMHRVESRVDENLWEAVCW